MSLLDMYKKAEAKAGPSGKKFEKVDWWLPKPGDNHIRILPATKKGAAPFEQVVIHFINIKKKDGSWAKIPVRCLADTDLNGGPVFPTERGCPLCRKHDALVKAGDKEAASNLRPAMRYIYNVIDMNTRSVHPYLAPKSVHDGIGEYLADFDDPFDLETGRDWKIKKSGTGLSTKYTMRPALKETALPEKLRHLVSEASDLKTLYSENEKKRMLEFLGEEAGDDDEETREEFDREIKATKVRARPEPEEEDEEPRAVAAKAKAKAAAVKAAPPEFDEDEEIPDFESPKKAATAPAKKAAPKEEDLGVSFEDEELEEELKALGFEDED